MASTRIGLACHITLRIIALALLARYVLYNSVHKLLYTRILAQNGVDPAVYL